MILNTTSTFSSPHQCQLLLKHTKLLFSPPTTVIFTNHSNKVITCSISKAHNYGTVDYERRTPLKWSALYKRIFMMENPELGASYVLNQWMNENRQLSKWDICRVIRELRKFRKYTLAFQVYQWMSNQGDKFSLYSSDEAILLDLIAKINGVPAAEEYFLGLPDSSKDKRTYGALLNVFAQAKMADKAESLLIEMRKRNYDAQTLSFNVMMTLYMKLKDYEKVILTISEMIENNVPLDHISYNIWLSTCGSMGSASKMEEVHKRLKEDSLVNPNWTVYSTMASAYIKLGQDLKAENCLKMVEGRITGRDRTPYHFLISLYGNIGKKEDVYRIWNTYKSGFPSIPNMAYNYMVASLVKLDCIDEAEQVYEEWLTVKKTFDPRIYNLLMGWYIKNGLLQKAEALLDQVLEGGGQPSTITWEILAEGNIKEKQILEALSYIMKAIESEKSKNFHWKLNPSIVSDFLLLCDEKADTNSKGAFLKLLNEAGLPGGEKFMSVVAKEDDDGAEMFLNDESGMLINQL